MAYQEQDASELEAIRRRRAIAEAMMSRSAQPIEVQQGGKYTVPISPFQGIAKLAEAYFGQKGAAAADADAKGIETKQQDRRAADISRISEALTGAPAITPPADPFGGGPGRPALPPDQAKVIQALIAAESPELQAQGLDMQIKSSVKKPAEPYNLREGELRFDSNNQVIAEGAPKSAKASGKYGLQSVSIGNGLEQDYETGLDGRVNLEAPIGKPRPLKTGTKITNVVGGSSKYVEERLEGEAKSMPQAIKGAESAYFQNKALDRFLSASKNGAQGSAEPIVTGVENFLSSFGYSSESLTDVRQMEQALGDIQLNRMREFGARGLTDQDMKILQQSIPRIATDKVSRDAVARILKKSNDSVIGEYENRIASEEKSFPELKGRVHSPAWLEDYRQSKRLDAAKQKYLK